MISLKRYLDAEKVHVDDAGEDDSPKAFATLLAAYRSGLAQMGECGANSCPALGAELKRGIARIDEVFGKRPDAREIAGSERALCDLLQDWGKKAALYNEDKAGEVRDLLLVMARTAESLGHKDERYAQELDSVTARLETIATLGDISRIRASVEKSAHDLRSSVARMTAENKTVIDHLRAEVSTYQAKLEKAEYVASCDSMTGLGSRLWIEGRIQQRIASSLPFSILMIDVDDFRRVNDEHGKLVGDLLLKEFARELRSSCRFSDVVARWGGDRFVVVLDCAGDDARGQAARLRTWICRPYHAPGRTGYVNVRLSVSIGLAESRDGDSMMDLLARADAALISQQALDRERMTA